MEDTYQSLYRKAVMKISDFNEDQLKAFLSISFDTPFKQFKNQKDALEHILEPLGKVSQGAFDDGSSSWVEVRIRRHIFTFSFVGMTDKLEAVSLHKDILDVTDTKLIFNSEKKKK